MTEEAYATALRLLEAYNEGFAAGRRERDALEAMKITTNPDRANMSSHAVEGAIQPMSDRPPRSFSLTAAFVSFLVANLIHNDFGVDPAIVPAAVLGGLYWWRPRPGLQWATAAMIALPSFLFLKPAALLDPSNMRAFLNHAALGIAGVLALLSVVRSFLAGRSPAGRA